MLSPPLHDEMEVSKNLFPLYFSVATLMWIYEGKHCIVFSLIYIRTLKTSIQNSAGQYCRDLGQGLFITMCVNKLQYDSSEKCF